MNYLYLLKVGGKSYVGVSSRPRRRLAEHRKAESLVGRALRKYGETQVEILGEFEVRSDAYEAEKEAIRSLGTKSPSGWNVTEGGEGMSGPSAETRRKLSEAMKRRQQLDPGLSERASRAALSARSEETEKARREASRKHMAKLNEDPVFREASRERMRAFNEHRHQVKV